MTTPVHFYFDFLSPFAYLARHELTRIAMQHGRTVQFHAVDLDRLKKAIGNVGPGNRDLPVKLAYIIQDLGRWAQRYSVPLAGAKNHNARPLNLGTFYAEDRNQTAEYVATAYRLTWGEGGAPDDPALHVALARSMGWAPEAFQAFIESSESSRRFEAATQVAIDRRVFGVPTVTVDDQMWWGNDRLFFVEEYLAQSPSLPQP